MSNTSNKDTILFTVVAIILFLAIFITHFYYREYTFTRSADSWIPSLQKLDNAIWKRFVQFIFWFGWDILWVVVIVFYAQFNRASSAFLLTTTAKFIAFIAALKMLWNDPAPYMSRGNINALVCSQNTFQTPSLEVALAAFVYCMAHYLAYDWIDVIRPRVKRTDKNTIQGGNNPAVYEDEDEDYFLHDTSSYQQAKERDFGFWVWVTFIIFTVFLISYAAMYLGINTLDQVVYAMCLGYGLFCVVYFYLKDWAVQRYILVSEKMIPSSQVIVNLVQQVVLVVLLIVGVRILYYFQIQDFTVNPNWKSEHFDECGILPFPAFFDKEMSLTYNFLYLDLGIVVGLAFDSLVLGGTRTDFNQLRTSEERSPILGFVFRFLITVGWILLNLWGFTSLLKMLIHHWLFILAIPYFLCGFGLFSFLKYIFEIVGATRPEIHPIPEMTSVELRKAD